MYTAHHHLTTQCTIHSIVRPLVPASVAQHRHTTSHPTDHAANKILPAWWENIFTYYQVKKHTIYGLSAYFLLNGFIPACLKTFLFAIYALTELSLHFKHPSHWNTARFKEENAWSQYGKTPVKLTIKGAFQNNCYYSSQSSAKRRLKVILLYDK